MLRSTADSVRRNFLTSSQDTHCPLSCLFCWINAMSRPFRDLAILILSSYARVHCPTPSKNWVSLPVASNPSKSSNSKTGISRGIVITDTLVWSWLGDAVPYINFSPNSLIILACERAICLTSCISCSRRPGLPISTSFLTVKSDVSESGKFIRSSSAMTASWVGNWLLGRC